MAREALTCLALLLFVSGCGLAMVYFIALIVACLDPRGDTHAVFWRLGAPAMLLLAGGGELAVLLEDEHE